ncbi:MAG TPA: sn-glycerol-3-phosphate ABC transporter ATP-binding protein UgpC [Proteus sp.]|uniref:sn-glycerol-3-phosphate ABC transporter ATP-binding protein UgpC n=1 Tax=Proteus hauseri TaxID=183417 RepID=UPI000ECAA86E|nr:sn-glycerol-3-phosphate ABC transporter ATP-binding protein UgpC [Proteus hauseri]QAV23548.1 sn-glycerol-3-phosphate ABC transporter ATP-binding protein UgpC [Proteus hauseri]HCH51612.1 sn-glycerol-3-phosphate ABC transporter ATP-binding protein UgpC [Proteus sp. (in: enterobacteria)]
MTTVTLTHLAKRYPNGHNAISSLSLSIEQGEMVVLVGPSGCGKSTLLRMIAGLETITEGDLLIDNLRVNEHEPSERDIAMVFQNYALYPHMSVYNNMAYGLRNRKTPKAKIEELVNSAAEMLEISHLLERKPKELSGGQRQRVAMGRAIVRKPKVFLFDEPLSNLDAKLRVQMRLEIKKLQRKLCTTSIYVTHDQVEAMTLADKLVVLNQGHIEQVGTPLDIYQSPASVFVATFMGSPAMNILETPINHGVIEIADGYIAISTQQWHFNTIKLGLRPEHLIIDNQHPIFHAEVEFIEALGADVLIYATTCDKQKQPIVIRAPNDHGVEIGNKIGLTIHPEYLHFFDAQTGIRIARPFVLINKSMVS